MATSESEQHRLANAAAAPRTDSQNALATSTRRATLYSASLSFDNEIQSFYCIAQHVQI